MFELFLIVFSFSVGLINLAPLFEIPSPWGDFNAEDILLLTLLVFIVPSYIRQRKKLFSLPFKNLERAWIVFILLLAVASFLSPAESLTERLVHVRFVQGYLLFFPTVAVITSERRLRLFAGFGLLIAVAGTILTVLQSLHGLENLFDSPFYDIGAWGGNKQIVEGITRVNLPVSNWIAYVILIALAIQLLKPNLSQGVVIGVLCITILLNFARSLWLGMLAAVFVELVVLMYVGAIKWARVSKIMVLPVSVAIVVIAAPLLGLQGLSDALGGRIEEGIFFFSAGAGTWGVRLAQSAAAYTLWSENWLFGIGTAYRSEFGGFIDMGLPSVLVSVGVVGFLAFVWLFGSCWRVGLRAAKLAFRQQSLYPVAIGVSVPALITLMLVYQQWLTPYVASVLGVASAIAAVSPVVCDVGDVRLARQFDRQL